MQAAVAHIDVTGACDSDHRGRQVAAGQSVAEDRVHEHGRIEERQVVRAFAESDELDGHAELSLHRDDDAALGRSVELGQDDAR